MVPILLSRLEPSRTEEIEDWPWLDKAVLRPSRSRQVCMTCHFFRHHPGPDRPRRAPHQPLPGLDRGPAPTAGLGAGGGLSGGPIADRRCRPRRPGLATAARCCTSGRPAGTAGVSSWRSRSVSCCRINRCRCSSGGWSSAARKPSSSGAINANRVGSPQRHSGDRPRHQLRSEHTHRRPWQPH